MPRPTPFRPHAFASLALASAAALAACGDVAARVAEFRTLLGEPANGGTAGQQPAGRREIGWDGAGANPFNNRNDFPTDFLTPR